MVNRRRFLEIGSFTLAAMAIPLYSKSEIGKSDVYVAESNDHAKAVRAAVEMANGIERFVKKGDVVAIKPNMAWAREPEFAANTNPVVVAEVVRLCYKAGAKEVIVTDNPCDNARNVFSLSKIPLFAQKENANVFIPQSRHYKNMDIGGRFLTDWPVLEVFKKADKVINIPVAKDHASSRVTIGMKNWMGAIGGNRGFLHQNLHQAIYELAAFFKPTLTIVDCTRVMLKGGPTGGDLRFVKELNRVIVSTDVVAADAIASEFLGVNPQDVQYLVMGYKNGLGNIAKTNISMRYEKL
ncbi:MAG: DUF362 domain-containing protein [Calditerrivibrio sp.]|nr:DUF362 domain-containing protein [Calditerrivibrio sp.]